MPSARPLSSLEAELSFHLCFLRAKNKLRLLLALPVPWWEFFPMGAQDADYCIGVGWGWRKEQWGAGVGVGRSWGQEGIPEGGGISPFISKACGPKWGGWEEQRGVQLGPAGLLNAEGKDADTQGCTAVCTPAPWNVCIATTLISCPRVKIRRDGNVSPAPCLLSPDNSVHGSILDSELLGLFVCLLSFVLIFCFALWFRLAHPAHLLNNPFFVLDLFIIYV